MAEEILKWKDMGTRFPRHGNWVIEVVMEDGDKHRFMSSDRRWKDGDLDGALIDFGFGNRSDIQMVRKSKKVGEWWGNKTGMGNKVFKKSSEEIMNEERIAGELVDVAKLVKAADDYTIDVKEVKVHPDVEMKVHTYSDDGSFFISMSTKDGYGLNFAEDGTIFPAKNLRRVLNEIKKGLKGDSWSRDALRNQGGVENLLQVKDDLTKKLRSLKAADTGVERTAAQIEGLSSSESRKFVKYVMDFYGKDGLYPLSDGRLKERDVVKATEAVLESGHDWADGDSFDREKVRDVLVDEMGYKWPKKASRVAGRWEHRWNSIKRVLHDYEDEEYITDEMAAEAGERIGKFLLKKVKTITDDWEASALLDIAEYLRDVSDVEDFDYYLNDLYDWADANRVWLGP